MILYRFIKIWATITSFFFFRKVTITRKGEIPEGTSVIFAPNHQSAFLDPIVIAINTKRSPWFLTRASVFTGGMVNKLLKMLHMIPVYRPRDLVDLKTANNSTFDFCQEVLTNGESIMIFPEGNHGMQKRLRTPLKKGIGRIALRAVNEMQTDPDRDVVIVPVGINYEHPTGMRTDLLLNFGEPISVKDLLKEADNHETRGLLTLRKHLAEKIQDLMIDIRPKEQYDALELAWQQQRTVLPSLKARFENDKEIIEALSENDQPLQPKPEIKSNSLWQIPLIILGFPMWLTGVVLNLGWILTVKLILKYVVKDPHFVQSIKFLCVMAGVPVFTMVTAALLSTVTGWFWPFVVLIPLFGLLAHEYQTRVLKTPGLVLVKDEAGDFLPED
ncbi:hypothetical protein E7Z59_06930 [Robertkochia marina]|uniref:Phospholipid/glycerol acyltransferase domain-containing protein n=1 Tax=Robertkochia marina TaxID=1227945 RepID=A0A4S3LZ50_9FLAO|nr:1-acyl-sn-glycerol-3-phosphate acyltransferase [Robertkochia marina]THD67390.1 hypothetical protein E7Z59_06930 [Robertkochia marina]TRZ43044.1 hypothetical protein D3A96_11235 [Robertkochia marina]